MWHKAEERIPGLLPYVQFIPLREIQTKQGNPSKAIQVRQKGWLAVKYRHLRNQSSGLS